MNEKEENQEKEPPEGLEAPKIIPSEPDARLQPTATNALRTASRLIQERPILLMPPLLMILLASALLGEGFQMMTFVSLGLLNLAVTAGWYRMLALAVAGKPSGWGDFLAGVGRHFVQFVLGSLAFILALILFSAPWVALGQRWAGDLNKIPFPLLQGQLAKGDLTGIDPGILLSLSRWSLIFCLFVLLFGLSSYFLLLWKQAVVVREIPWPQAWAVSARLAVTHWKPLCAILAVNGVAWVAAIALRLLGGGFVGYFLASFASLVAEIYFRAAFTAFFVLSEPEEVKSEK